MDSKDVNALIRSRIKPVLKQQGFERFTSRTAWRFTADRVEVLNFQSFNSYTAEVMGTTTYSFSVNLGSYLACVPEQYPIKRKDGRLVPEEYQSHLRGRLHKSLLQSEFPSDDLWFIDPAGRYLEPAFDDVIQTLHAVGLPWFERLRSDEAVLSILLHDDESMGGLWGFGNHNSPQRNLLTGFVALHLGQMPLAKDKLAAARAYEPFEHLVSATIGG